MQTLMPERSGALSIAPLGGGSIEGGRAAEHAPLPAEDLGSDEQQPVGELRPSAPVALGTREESIERGARVVVRGKGKAPAEARMATDRSSAEFVLALPRNLSASEAVALAREQGITISEPYVYKIRYEAMAWPEPASAAPIEVAPADDDSKAADNPREALAPDAPKAATVPPRTKSEFIGGLPTDLSPKEVVARAKAQGISISRSYVQEVRAAAKARAMPLMPTAPAKVKPAPTGATPSKADFVRSLPSDLSYAQAAARAKDAGIRLSPAHFYAIKRQAKNDTAAARKSKPGHKPMKKASPAQVDGLRLTSNDAREQSLIDVVRVLGVSRARAVIDAIERFEELLTE